MSQPFIAIPADVGSVVHVVHDYANLLSSGKMADSGYCNDVKLRYNTPLNHHVGEAFLMNCRKMEEFLSARRNPRHTNDLRASDFLDSIEAFEIPTWTPWRDAMNDQLLHVSRKRDMPWNGHKVNKQLLQEFIDAWGRFRGKVKTEYKDKFDEQIAAKKAVRGYEAIGLT